MQDPTVEFDATYPDALLNDATRVFVRYAFNRYLGWKIIAACVVNLLAFAFVFAYGTETFIVVGVGMIAAMGPAYCAMIFFVYPRKIVTALKRRLQPSAHISISSSGFSLAAKGRAVTMPWTDLRAVLEFSEYFLLVLSPFAFTIIPKKDQPLAAQQMVRNKLGRHAA